ncbi:MAG TPA: TlpA disulfide reductase family protein [Streptosporangiaceae bacterium]|jgi:thiol-disulfide isomerase/thioredoxin
MIAQDHDDAPLAARGEATNVRTPMQRLRAMSRGAKIATGSAVAAVVVAVVLVLAAASGPGRQVAPPRPAKSFSLDRLGMPEATVSLGSYQGQPVIVNFFASWCGPCQRETPLLARYYETHAGHVNVVGIDANDQQAAALSFIAQKGVRYPIGWDPFPAATTTSYGVFALPQTFFLNSRHQIVAHVMGALTASVLTRDVALMNQSPSQDGG